VIGHFWEREQEQEYRDWVNCNPSGFVLNTSSVPDAPNLKTHRSGCQHIERFLCRNPLGDQSKHCSLDLAELGRWARDETGGEIDPCSYCKPNEG